MVLLVGLFDFGLAWFGLVCLVVCLSWQFLDQTFGKQLSKLKGVEI